MGALGSLNTRTKLTTVAKPPYKTKTTNQPSQTNAKVLFARAYTHEAQLDLLAGVAAKMVDEPFKLLIVDSIMANFRCAFG
jgi:RecA/RadA recombinase